ncbi:MAG: hypothetical protein KIT63_26175 [Rhodoferax sp.]|nr:hypothetical protein [Rhodoferax sp.]
MPCRPARILTALLVLGAMSACAPTFNWRELPIGSTALQALFPCKPETVTRPVPLAQVERDVAMRSCDTGGVTFAVAHAALSQPGQAPAVLSDWRASTLSGLRADAATVSSDPPGGLPALPQLLVLRVAGAPGDAQARSLLGVWFATGRDVFAAFVMGPAIPPEAAETFFSGLRLR